MTVAWFVLGVFGVIQASGILLALQRLIAAVTDHTAALRTVSELLKLQVTALTTIAASDTLVARSVTSLTETLKSPLQVDMTTDRKTSLEHAPAAKGTH